MKELKAYHLTGTLHRYLAHTSELCLTNSYVWGHFESDFIRVTKSLYLHEFEVKISVLDFKQDFLKGNKSSRWDKEKKKFIQDVRKKHDKIREGESPLATFSFVAPVGLIKPEMLPPYAGLYEVHIRRCGTECQTRYVEVVRPKRLKNAQPLSYKKMAHLFKKTYFHYVRSASALHEERLKELNGKGGL